jgi:two-component sensor histidine kinase
MPQSAILRKLRRHQDVLRELAFLTTAQELPANLLHACVVQVARAVEIDHVKVMRYRPENGDLLLEAGVGWKEGYVGHATFSLDLASPGGSAFQTGQPVFIPNLPESTEFRQSAILREHDIVSVLNVPITVGPVTWGVLEVDSVAYRNFSLDTQNFLLAAGAVLGTALCREQVQTAHRTALADAALATQQRELLFNELHHRVKNNFQIIVAMIAHERRLMDRAAQEVLTKLADNILAMALAHDQLATSRTKETIKLAAYLETLAVRIQKPIPGLIVEVKAEDYDVTVELAVPLGLIMNELITNSVKHAFGPAGGTVRVDLAKAPQHGEVQLIIADNGKGGELPAEAGTGLTLIDALARQVRGRVERESTAAGMRTTVFFPSP